MHEEGVITDGGAATDRGGRKGNLHLQCSFWLPTLNRNAAEVQAAMSTLVCEFAEFMGSDRHVYAVVHEPANEPNVTWRTQCGYDLHVVRSLCMRSRCNNAETSTECRKESIDASSVAMSDSP
jgi:hypothetical protein